MKPCLVAHLQVLRETIRIYEESRRLYMAPGERARRIKQARDVIDEIERLAALDEPLIVSAPAREIG